MPSSIKTIKVKWQNQFFPGNLAKVELVLHNLLKSLTTVIKIKMLDVSLIEVWFSPLECGEPELLVDPVKLSYFFKSVRQVTVGLPFLRQ
jgi:hypothetical protein